MGRAESTGKTVCIPGTGKSKCSVRTCVRCWGSSTQGKAGEVEEGVVETAEESAAARLYEDREQQKAGLSFLLGRKISAQAGKLWRRS